MAEQCESQFLDLELNIPTIGICDHEISWLVMAIIWSLLIQFTRHAIWDRRALVQYNLFTMSKDDQRTDDKKCCKCRGMMFEYMMLFLASGITWVVTILLIANANLYVILAHLIADVYSCRFWMLRSGRMGNSKEIDVKKIKADIIQSIEAKFKLHAHQTRIYNDHSSLKY